MFFGVVVWFVWYVTRCCCLWLLWLLLPFSFILYAGRGYHNCCKCRETPRCSIWNGRTAVSFLVSLVTVKVIEWWYSVNTWASVLSRLFGLCVVQSIWFNALLLAAKWQCLIPSNPYVECLILFLVNNMREVWVKLQQQIVKDICKQALRRVKLRVMVDF